MQKNIKNTNNNGVSALSIRVKISISDKFRAMAITENISQAELFERALASYKSVNAENEFIEHKLMEKFLDDEGRVIGVSNTVIQAKLLKITIAEEFDLRLTPDLNIIFKYFDNFVKVNKTHKIYLTKKGTYIVYTYLCLKNNIKDYGILRKPFESQKDVICYLQNDMIDKKEFNEVLSVLAIDKALDI